MTKDLLRRKTLVRARTSVFFAFDCGMPMAYNRSMSMSPPVTVIETPSFLRDSKKHLTDNEQANLSQADRNALKTLSAILVEQYGGDLS
ncbi:MAG: hypothetical protein LBS31_08890 [Candidatus Adiutrix sp.]|jgi:hypothetical protein|nr:hypothetical protein [Candidatus Adiutrix sp.]